GPSLPAQIRPPMARRQATVAPMSCAGEIVTTTPIAFTMAVIHGTVVIHSLLAPRPPILAPASGRSISMARGLSLALAVSPAKSTEVALPGGIQPARPLASAGSKG